MEKESEFSRKILRQTMKWLLDLIKKRRSIRRFKDTPIAEADLRELIEAGIYAPSGSNTQCYRFSVIENREDIEFLGEKKIPIVANAQAIILVVADFAKCDYLRGSRKDVFDKLPYQDCAMAMQNIVLLAESKSISSCVIHLSEYWHSAEEIANRFNIPLSCEMQGLILLGYADEVVDYKTATHAGRPIKRKKVEDYILEWRKK